MSRRNLKAFDFTSSNHVRDTPSIGTMNSQVRKVSIVSGLCFVIAFIYYAFGTSDVCCSDLQQNTESGCKTFCCNNQDDADGNLLLQISKHTDLLKESTKSKTKTPIKKAMIKGPGRYRLEFPGGLRVIEYKSQTFFQMSWAQFGQDVYVYHLLKERNNGFFVEAGAFDGEKFSNTLYLEIMRNWEGVLVEPNPYIFKDLVSKGRKSYMLNACLGNDTKLEFLLGNWLTSAHKVLNDEHKDRIDSITQYNEENYKSLRQKQHDGENVTVFCYSLFEILNSIGRSHVDFFSLDVEGAELYILQSLDWDKLTIDVFAVETYYNREKIMDFLIKKGYKWVHKIELDDFFIRTDLII